MAFNRVLKNPERAESIRNELPFPRIGTKTKDKVRPAPEPERQSFNEPFEPGAGGMRASGTDPRTKKT